MKSLRNVEKRKKYFTIKRTPRSSSIIQDINRKEKTYTLSLNRNLVSFRPTKVEPLKVCNLRKAFRYEEKLKYYLNGKCYDYDNEIVKQYLLNRLKNNKIVHISQIIAPKQIDSNCWFNALFMMFFVSDRGRIFFHYMRELMIKGETLTTKIEDVRMRNVFALLNFIIECCLSGNPLAHHLNTNKIIKKISELAKEKNIRITDVHEAGNPIDYYQTLVRYLGKNELKIVYINYNELDKITDPPHIIIVHSFGHKVPQFSIGQYVYELDSASVLDNGMEHVCSTITCNGVEFVFDGYSRSRLIPFEWKKMINENVDWGFKDYIYKFDTETFWNFTKTYSALCYYRIQ